MKHLLEYYSFSELSDDAKENAIENVRIKKYDGGFGGSFVAEDSIDDDALFEPSEEEMEYLFGPGYYEANGAFMIENDRDFKENISFVSKDDQNYYLHCAKALNVTNDNLFFRWLGIPPKYFKYFSYTFIDMGTYTFLDFYLDDAEALDLKYGAGSSEKLQEYFEKAEEKWKSHMSAVLSRITSFIEDQFSDEAIENDIDSIDPEFDEEGNLI